jgi:metal-responsive CopG/Arc/MetJ family transcriptional regulator
MHNVRRMSVYLEDDLWAALEALSQESGMSVSALVRQAVRERYGIDRVKRQKAMQAFVGIRKDRTDIGDPETYIRRIRSRRQP